MFNQGITSMRVFRITEQHLELQCRLAATTRFLVRPIAIVNQKRLWYTRVPYNTALLRLRIFISHIQLPRVGSSTLRVMVIRVQILFPILLGHLQHLLLLLV
jgi:hypothetical protein